MIAPSKLTLKNIWFEHYPKDHLRSKSRESCLNSIERVTPGLTTRDITTISDDDLSEFRDTALKTLAPSTVVTLLKFVTAMYRCVATRMPGNARGKGIIDYQVIPYARYPHVKARKPRRIKLEDLSAFYAYCGRATMPKSKGVGVADWWRTLVVLILSLIHI